MIINPNLAEGTPKEPGIMQITESTSDGFTKAALSLLYPPRKVKRILFRPYVGKLFPYIDVETPNQRTQLSFFYGRVNICFSRDRRCIGCGTILNKEESERKRVNLDSIPLYLCNKCEKRIFYDYWECLHSTIIHATRPTLNQTQTTSSARENGVISKGNKGTKPNRRCDNFLEARCGYPIDSPYINPCLKNHGIGLLISDDYAVKVLAAPLDILRYMMMWEGGIIGIILGRKRQIINLEMLEENLQKVIYTTKIAIHNCGCQANANKENDDIILRVPQVEKNRNNKIYAIPKQSILYSFLKYYKAHEVQKYSKILIDKPLFILKSVLEEVGRVCKLYILEFINLYERYPPLNFQLRKSLEALFTSRLNIKKVDQFQCSMMNDIHSKGSNNQSTNELFKLGEFEISREFKAFLNSFWSYEHLELSNLTQDLEIYRIMGAFGKILIVESNQSNKPITLNMNELSGRLIY